MRRELERAMSSAKIIIPFRLEDIRISKEMEFFVAGSHWLDAFPPPLEDHIDRLAGAINAFLKGESSAPSEPTKKKRRDAVCQLPWRVGIGFGVLFLLLLVFLELVRMPAALSSTQQLRSLVGPVSPISQSPSTLGILRRKSWAILDQGSLRSLATVESKGAESWRFHRLSSI